MLFDNRHSKIFSLTNSSFVNHLICGGEVFVDHHCPECKEEVGCDFIIEVAAAGVNCIKAYQTNHLVADEEWKVSRPPKGRRGKSRNQDG
jgi:hypothetical protein